ncbi:MAG TPA: helix-turn-helix transcriptional regulator [Tepidisphaeraceae bacterium]|jgi:transcriptional regulator with XRE-family HTH domain
MTFQQKLIKLTRNMKHSVVAADAGITPASLCNILAGRQSPRMQTAISIANALEVDFKWLIDPRSEFPVVRIEPKEVEQATAV